MLAMNFQRILESNTWSDVHFSSGAQSLTSLEASATWLVVRLHCLQEVNLQMKLQVAMKSRPFYVVHC